MKKDNDDSLKLNIETKVMEIRGHIKGPLTEGEIKGNVKPHVNPIVQTAPPPPPAKPKNN